MEAIGNRLSLRKVERISYSDPADCDPADCDCDPADWIFNLCDTLDWLDKKYLGEHV
jgi:hypothetical protein